jgi:hypothetical protein
MANAADNFQWNADNVFKDWDLNPLAMEVGAGADGVRDTLATKRDAFLQPYAADYRQKVGAGNSNDDDYGLWQDNDFREFVRTGQTSKGYAPDNNNNNNNSSSTTQQWTAPKVETAREDPRRQQLYDVLMQRINRSETVDRNDPVIRAQSDANIANEERARRNYVSDAAERGGPLANIQGERRMAAERAGQRTGTFEAALMGQELQQRRQQAAQALAQAGGQLDADQRVELQERLANLDAAIKAQGMGLQEKGLNQDWQRALLQNDQFLRQLGLNEWDRVNYWDALRSGVLG